MPTFFNPMTNEVYSSNMPMNFLDECIPDCPFTDFNGFTAKYNPETKEWEKVYEKEENSDLTVAEAEFIYNLMNNGKNTEKKMLGSILAKLANL